MPRSHTLRLTPAAERALRAAASWSALDEPLELEVPELLLGLLAEPECRAAGMLAAVGIDAGSVLERWPRLRLIERPQPTRSERPSAEVRAAFWGAQARLGECPQPVELATEHLLLGLAAADDEFGRWLRERGLSAEWIETEIRRIYGFAESAAGPIELDEHAPIAEGVSPGTADSPSLAIRQFDDEPGEAAHPAPPPTAALRALDAAANRAREGLRVVEDWLRFGLDDPHLTRRCKEIRHALAAALAEVSRSERLACRDALADVGTGLSTPAESLRASAADLLAANFGRASEALRSLEEHAKLLARPGVAEACQRLRYETYTLERAADAARASLDRLATARLYVLLDGASSADEAAARAAALAAAGVHLVQLRDKGLPDRELLARARAIRRALHGTPTLLIVNDRPDLARLADADGVHLGQDDLPVKEARAVLGPRLLVGVSVHSLAQARQAVLAGASYLGVGPTFPSTTKEFGEFPGLDLLRQVAGEIRLPAFAIGGIGPENIDQVLAAGLRRVAVSAAVARASNPGQAAAELLRKLR
jgi:thiamine-phosphate pyrophosphorylase